MSDIYISRRDFLVGGSAVGVAISADGSAQHIKTTKEEPREANCAKVGAFTTLTEYESIFLNSAVDTLIPADQLTPSGSNCGIVSFIDKQLGSDWGGGYRLYRSGPFIKGKPEQGYQLPLTPREFFKIGITATNDWTNGFFGKAFYDLSSADKVLAFQMMESGKADHTRIDLAQFFKQLLSISFLGFFSDPIYGGNRNKISWKVLGYPGLPALYEDRAKDLIENKRIGFPSRSIEDFL